MAKDKNMALKHAKAKKEAIKAALDNQAHFSGTTWFRESSKSAYSLEWWAGKRGTGQH